MTFYKFTQGVEEKIRVYSPSATLFLKNSLTLVIFSDVRPGDVEGEYWLKVKINLNNFIGAGLANYQLFENDQLKLYGSCQIIPSLMVDSNQLIRGKYAVIVEAILAQLAGIATRGQKHVQVGDKTIDKYSAELLKSLLSYFQGKLAEEEAGSNVNTKTDLMKIKYIWGGF